MAALVAVTERPVWAGAKAAAEPVRRARAAIFMVNYSCSKSQKRVNIVRQRVEVRKIAINTTFTEVDWTLQFLCQTLWVPDRLHSPDSQAPEYSTPGSGLPVTLSRLTAICAIAQ